MYIDMGLFNWTKGCTPGGGVRGRGILEKGGTPTPRVLDTRGYNSLIPFLTRGQEDADQKVIG